MIDKIFARRPSLAIWLVALFVVTAVVFVAPLLTRFGADALRIGRSHWIAMGGVAAAYLCTASWVAGKLMRREPFRLSAVASVAGILFGAVFFVLIVWGAQFSRIAFLSAVAIALLGLLAPLASWRLIGAGLWAGAAGIALFPMITNAAGIGTDPEIADGFVHTAHYALDLRRFDLPLTQSSATGGALENFGPGYMVVNGDGNFFYFEISSKDSIDIRALNIHAPMNAAEFDADVAPDVDRTSFRTADLLVLPSESGVRLLASHLFWNRAENCYMLRVSELATTRESLLAGSSTEAWRTVFEAQPCIPLREPTARPWSFDKLPFTGQMSGGRLLDLGDGQVMLTVGDHSFDGWNAQVMYSQDRSADHGKVIVFDAATGESRHFSIGHRNPQGLALDTQGRIWSTEHGPQGGDELNLLIEGANYGWPYYTYGTEYSDYEWPLLWPDEAAAGFETPRFAWVPSFGISSLIAVRDTTFPLWRGNLLVSALEGQSISRIRLEGDRVVFAEPIPVGVRVRDLLDGDGGIVVLGDDNSITLIRPAALDGRGMVVFGRCVGCHEVGAGAAQGLGPNLTEIIGRDIAAVSGFTYSQALRNLEGTWTEERLDRFIANPAAEVPGTTMAFPGISDAAQRAALIEYLRSIQ